MEFLLQLTDNIILITSLLSWFTAQVIKTVINAVIMQDFDLRRMIGDGGMPSAHSATVTGLALMTGLECGFDTPVFAVAVILAAVVMHDASGVRYETQKQATAIEQIVSYFNELLEENISLDVKLKKFVGHSKLQVVAGAIVGIAVSLLVYFW